MVAEVIAGLLQDQGYTTAIANSGNAGVQLVLDTLPNVVVCDMRMPGMGGHEVIQILKNQPTTSHIPVVVVTGFCDPEYFGVGDAFMTKPFKCDKLVATVDRMAKSPHARPAPPRTDLN